MSVSIYLRDTAPRQGANFCTETPRKEAIRFTLIIPALNEEGAIASALQRSLSARSEIIENTPIVAMNVVLVNDGSTDRTQAIADAHAEIASIHFEKNRGYGAAIKAGFHATDAELLGFMDGDGTCDPRLFVDLINSLIANDADVAVGSRMNANTYMPLIRRIGNAVFANLIGRVSGEKITDCASGMRVLRRSSLRHMHPLPDGLHFTPAMTCLAVFNPKLRMVEVPIPYTERIGRSKLRLIQDGFKFLFVILFTAALFNPIKSLVSFGLLFLLFGICTSIIERVWWNNHSTTWVWHVAFLGVTLHSVFVGFLCHKAMTMLWGPARLSGFCEAPCLRRISSKTLICTSPIIFGCGVLVYLVQSSFPGPWNKIASILGAFLVICAGWAALGGVLLRVLWTASERRNAENSDPYSIHVK